MKYLLLSATLLAQQFLCAETIVPKGSGGWHYLNVLDGSDPGTGDPDFHSTWFHQSSGAYSGGTYNGPAFSGPAAAPFHYGIVNGLAGGTELIAPPEGIDRTSYFFLVFDGGEGFNNLNLSLLADDGAFIYLNGTLIARDGVTDPDAFAQTADLGNEENYDIIPLIGSPAVLPGPNLLAISVHQNSLLSSDLGFDLELTGSSTTPVPAILRGPYLQCASHDRMTIRWRTDQPGSTVVRYGDAPGNLTQSHTLAGPVTDHVATLAGLPANTNFFYQVETATPSGSAVAAGNDSAHRFTTAPQPGARQPVRIWVSGDTGTTSSAKQEVYQSYLSRTGGAHTDIWLMLGDNAYEDGTDAEFQAALFDAYPELLRKTPLWSCFGNHDAYTASGAPYFDLHTFPAAGECGGVPSGTERYYSFDHGNIHIVSIDSETPGNYDDAPGSGGMIDWLDQDLRSTDKDWIIAIMHHGPYTRGTVDSDDTPHLVEMRHYVIPLLEKYGADLVIYGHSHVYERSMLINGHHSALSTAGSTAATFNSSVHLLDAGNGSTLGGVDATSNFVPGNGTGAYQKPLATGESGTVYVTCGASGQLSGWINGSYTPLNPAPHPVFSVSLLAMGSMAVQIEGNSLNAQYIDQWGSLRDDFTIVKGSTAEAAAADSVLAELGPDPAATFTITRSGAISLPENISYQIAGSASPGSDFTLAPANGTVAFAAGQTSREVTLTRVPDQLAEGPETIQLSLAPSLTGVSGGTGMRQRYFRSTTAGPVTATLLDSPAQQWWADSFGPGETTSAGWQVDDDHDGLSRLAELAFGGLEGTYDRHRLPEGYHADGILALDYFRNSAIPNLIYQPQRSAGLVEWTTGEITTQPLGPADPSGFQPFRSATSRSATRGFIRLQLTLDE